MISESLRAIVSQRLIPIVDGSRRVPALEILLVNLAVSNLIREERVFQLRSVMQTGREPLACVSSTIRCWDLCGGGINHQGSGPVPLRRSQALWVEQHGTPG